MFLRGEKAKWKKEFGSNVESMVKASFHLLAQIPDVLLNTFCFIIGPQGAALTPPIHLLTRQPITLLLTCSLSQLGSCLQVFRLGQLTDQMLEKGLDKDEEEKQISGQGNWPQNHKKGVSRRHLEREESAHVIYGWEENATCVFIKAGRCSLSGLRKVGPSSSDTS